MEKYKEILEEIARKETRLTFFGVLALVVVVALTWISFYLWCRKKKFNSQKQIKTRRQSTFALITLTVIAVLLAGLTSWGTVKTVSEINKDIEDDAYIEYIGDYHIYDADFNNMAFDRYLDVSLENGESALIYMNNIFERISMDEGHFEGKVVYGKNSAIVVDICD